MSADPWDDCIRDASALVIAEQRHGVRPTFFDVSAACRVIYGEADRGVDRDEQNWTDFRPRRPWGPPAGFLMTEPVELGAGWSGVIGRFR
ncbi:hypothetical protein [Mycobacterium sp. 1274761.0]|uniref:hypothetical protein n=1 Tax=Mycobacterium sp. 1274761.0 TaxID=1834077 RepID=UPI0007FFE711|nr:hypothetical protein [Mycobacterium sp. 1274761.0]OBK71506.1 hypothetical protein A5651_18500 [Mycobacterium sp. 1274761.0]